MASEYWMLKRGDEYEQMNGRLGSRLNAYRYILRHAALSRSDCYTPPLRLVHVRVRSRSERLYLAGEVARLRQALTVIATADVSREELQGTAAEAMILNEGGSDERLYLAERLAAWEPVVAAAEEMRRRWDERASPAKQQDAQVAVVVACRGVPKEHRR